MNQESSSPDRVAEPRGEGADEAPVPADDTVIATAFKRSLVVLAAAAALAGGVLWWARDDSTPERVEEVELQGPRTLAEAIDTRPPEVGFGDITAAAGIRFRHVNGAYGERLLPETMGGGVAFFDYDNDADPDLLLVNSAPWPWAAAATDSAATSALYRNRGDGTFEDVSREAGLDAVLYGMGVAVGDYDADGFVDVFLTALGANRLYRNIAGERFEDVTAEAGVGGDDSAWSTSAAFFDFDRDGDLDLFVANYVEWSREIDFEVDYRLTGIGRAYGPPANYAGTHSYLYRNDGDGRFSEVSAAAGIHVAHPATGAAVGKALAVIPLDMDADGWLDMIVANDTVRNFLFRNTGAGGFEEIGALMGIAFDNSGKATGAMGVDAAYYNNDADLAVAIGNFANEMTSFFVAQEGVRLFTDEAIVAGIGPDSRQALSFGVFFFDYDLDGRLDMLQANGHVEDEINLVQPSQHYEQPVQLFWNCGGGCARNFIAVPADTLGDLGKPLVGRGAAYADIDGDGDLDVAITQIGRRPLLVRNEQRTGHYWIRVRLLGDGGNRDAIGARVVLRAGDGVRERLVMPARSYLSQVELPVTFGLGTGDRAELLTIHWPDGTVQEIRDPEPGRLLVIEKPRS